MMPQGNARINVIISSKNDSAFIAATLESVLSQQYQNIVIHVQDCLSTDGTVDILKKYPIQYRSEQDLSIADAFNRGVANTDGDILIFLGADDPMLPGAISAYMNAFYEDPTLGFVYGDTEYINENGVPFFRLKGQPFDLDNMFWANTVPSQSVAVTRDALLAVGGYRHGNHMCDWEVRLKMGARYKSRYIPKLLGQYSVHSNSFTIKYQGTVARAVCDMAAHCLQDEPIKNALRYGQKRAMAGCFLVAARTFVLGNEVANGAQCLAKAISQYPLAIFSKSFFASAIAVLLRGRGYRWLREFFRKLTLRRYTVKGGD